MKAKIDITQSGHYTGDCRELLRRLPARCVQTVVTSPPYYGLRDYGHPGQIGLEKTPAMYVDTMVKVMRAVRRVLKDDGTVWLNLGDCYVTRPRGPGGAVSSTLTGTPDHERRKQRWEASGPSSWKGSSFKTDRKRVTHDGPRARKAFRGDGLKNKDLVGIPWRVAFALQADGWWLRSDIIWHKPNPMPESVTDRPTKAHEYIFLLSKSETYYYDQIAIREPCVYGNHPRNGVADRDDDQAPGQPRQNGISKVRRSGNKERSNRAEHGGAKDTGANQAFGVPWTDEDGFRNKRSVWSVTTAPYSEAHFATFPPKLIEPCILAGSKPGDLVLDLFFGSGTTGEVAEKHLRRWIGFDINPSYAELAKVRTAQRSLPMY